MYRKIIIVAVTAFGVAHGSACVAQQRTRVVSYRDLDLTTLSAQKALDRRLRHAVDYVCRLPSPSNPLTGTEDPECRTEPLARVQSRMQGAIQLAQTRAASEFATR